MTVHDRSNASPRKCFVRALGDKHFSPEVFVRAAPDKHFSPEVFVGLLFGPKPPRNCSTFLFGVFFVEFQMLFVFQMRFLCWFCVSDVLLQSMFFVVQILFG